MIKSTHKSLNDYIDTYFQEKEIENKTFEIETDKFDHFIDTETVIEIIKKSKLSVKEQIVDKLIEIDLYNSSVNDFLKYIAKGYVKTNY